jgi:thymidylate synthase
LITECRASLGVAWLDCLRTIVVDGTLISDGHDRLKEIRNHQMTITSADPDDALLRKFADRARIELMYEKYGSLEVLPQYKISYGALLYDNDGVDQVDWVVRRLRSKRETKSATITMHTPGASELSCLSMLDFKVRDDALHMTAVYRSQNVYASQPGNVLALRRVQEQVAAKVDAATGELTLHAISAHVYEPDLPAATAILAAYDAGQVQ